MKNRSRYITQRNEYDLLLNILARSIFDCPIYVISNMSIENKNQRCKLYANPETGNKGMCENCMQAWLNEEEKRT